MQVKNFTVPDSYNLRDAVPVYPMDEGANVLKTSDQQIQLLNRLIEKIGKGSAKMEAVRESIANLETNLSGSNEKLNYNRIVQRVQGDEWVTPPGRVTETCGYADPENNQIHVRFWHLGARNEEEYLQAKAQFEKNIETLKGGLNDLKTVQIDVSQSLGLPTSALAAMAFATLALSYYMLFTNRF